MSELILQGWLCLDDDWNISISSIKDEYGTSLSQSIMGAFNYTELQKGLGAKRTIIPNAHLRIWFSDTECTLEEAQMNLDSYMETGELFTEGHYIGYSEWTITGFNVDELTIGGHDLDAELQNHTNQYIHLILTD